VRLRVGRETCADDSVTRATLDVNDEEKPSSGRHANGRESFLSVDVASGM
jgi:hypothetical protein